MTTRTLILRSLRYYWRTHLGVLLGVAVSVAVLAGALLVGDSVQHTLRSIALSRLGRTELALASRERFFRATLADELELPSAAVAAPVLALRGSVQNADRTVRVANVQVLGVDERFWRLGGGRTPPGAGERDAVAVNTRLAERLGVREGQEGQEIFIRVEKPALLSRDTRFSSADAADATAGITASCRAVVSDAELGRFSLQADQVAPYNVFVPLDWLGEKVARAGRANMLLVGGTDGELTSEQADAALRKVFRLEDAELQLRELPRRGQLELRTNRVFLDAPVAAAALKAAPGARGVLTYLVNELRLGDRATPYSMVAAMESLPQSVMESPAGASVPPSTPLKDDEIVINDWLADDLKADLDADLDDLDKRSGDVLTLKYYVLGPMRSLDERTERFRVRRVVPLRGPAADRDLMPSFPGLEKLKRYRDWKTDIPIVRSRIRPKDEQYWRNHGGTPKAFITLRAGRRIWANRFGDLTAVRYPRSAGDEKAIAVAIQQRLAPASIGLRFQPVREQAILAAESVTDFGGLFLGMSFFLIVAALLLMALLLSFGIEQRAEQVGLLLGVGFTPGKVRRILLIEVGVLAVAGGLIGSVGGTLYARAMLVALATVWGSAASGASIRFHAEPATLAQAAGLGTVVALGAMWLALRNQVRRPARELLSAGAQRESHLSAPAGKRRRIGLWVGGACALAAIALVVRSLLRRESGDAEGFFAAGALLLTAGIALVHWRMSATAHRAGRAIATLDALAIRNASRRRRRSLATVAALACGCFVIIGVGVFRRDGLEDAAKPSSGTAGYALVGVSSLPVHHDLNTAAGRDAFALDAGDLAGVRIEQLRVLAGDDASCLNLNRARRPRLVAVRPGVMQRRGALTFVETVAAAKGDPWSLLAEDQPDGAIPAFGDEATVRWAMGKRVGETLEYLDDRGRSVRIRIVGMFANSIFQGSLLIGDEAFARHFPSANGYRMFLIDAPANRADDVSKTLRDALCDVGLEISGAAERLARFNRVENSYVSIFQALGGLGMLLGSAGLGMVVLRNVLERRSELALLRAVGFTKRSLRRMVLIEHAWLGVLGMTIGAAAAMVAVFPSLRSPGTRMPWVSLSLTLAAVLVSGLLWTILATLAALKGPLLEALRSE